MILVQISTALAIGAYVVLSKDAQPKRLDAPLGPPGHSIEISYLAGMTPIETISLRHIRPRASQCGGNSA
jgi:hypothetical protein